MIQRHVHGVGVLSPSRYSSNPKYIGGAVAFSADDFRKINGFPNTFWGWGGEDDEMYKRIQEVSLFDHYSGEQLHNTLLSFVTLQSIAPH